MKNGFMTIKQASAYTGKHPDTIRSLVRKNRGTEHISADNKKRVLISSSLLAETYEIKPPEPPQKPVNKKSVEGSSVDNDTPQSPTEQGAPAPQSSDQSELLKALTEQLRAKDEQIAELTKTVSKALDQQQVLSGLLLNSGGNPAPEVQVTPEPPTDIKPEKIKVGETTKQVKKPKKKKWYNRKI